MSDTVPNRSVKLFTDFASKIENELDYDSLIQFLGRDNEPPIDQWTIGSISEQAGCHIRFSDMAIRDLELYTLLAQEAWGNETSNRFLEFLRVTIIALVKGEIASDIFDPLPGCEAYVAEFPERPAGHLIVFRRLQDGMAILFMLNLLGPKFPQEDSGIEAIYRFHVVGPIWAGCDPAGTQIRY